MMRSALGLLWLLAVSAIPAAADGIPSQDPPNERVTASLSITNTGSNPIITSWVWRSTTPEGTTTPLANITLTIPGGAIDDPYPVQTFTFTSIDQISSELDIVSISSTGGTVPGCGFPSTASVPSTLPSTCPEVFDALGRTLFLGETINVVGTVVAFDAPEVVGSFSLTVTVAPTPEPGTGVITLIGLGLLTLMMRRRMSQDSAHAR